MIVWAGRVCRWSIMSAKGLRVFPKSLNCGDIVPMSSSRSSCACRRYCQLRVSLLFADACCSCRSVANSTRPFGTGFLFWYAMMNIRRTFRTVVFPVPVGPRSIIPGCCCDRRVDISLS